MSLIKGITEEEIEKDDRSVLPYEQNNVVSVCLLHKSFIWFPLDPARSVSMPIQ